MCGKGVDAAVVTALARPTIRAAAVNQHQPSEIPTTLNQVLVHHGGDQFCTVTLARLRRDGDTWTATVSCAGHPPPLLRRPGAATQPIGRFGRLLGALDEPRLFDDQVAVLAGDAILLYTDGVTEARQGAQFFGEERLGAAFARLPEPAAAIVDGIQ